MPSNLTLDRTVKLRPARCLQKWFEIKEANPVGVVTSTAEPKNLTEVIFRPQQAACHPDGWVSALPRITHTWLRSISSLGCGSK